MISSTLINIQSKTIARLTVQDRSTFKSFLIDTGAEVSVIPPNRNQKLKSTSLKLFAVNGTPIEVYGQTFHTLDFGLRRPYTWCFIVANVNSHIIGADFLSHHDLLVDIKRNRLVDARTLITSRKLCAITSQDPSPQTINRNIPFADIIALYPNITKLSQPGATTNSHATHFIETNGPPCSARARRLPQDKLAAAKQEIELLMAAGICRPSKSNWSSPLHMVRKPDGSWRPCGDYRNLNTITIPDRYPLPYLHDFTNILAGKTVFGKIDLQKAFHQVPVNPEDIPKTAIITPFGLFEFTHMTFGLRNAAQTFQRLIHEVLRGLDFTFPYMDDICIASSSQEEHRHHIKQIFDRLTMHNLSINIAKCTFGQENLEFLGHYITKDGIVPLPKRVDALNEIQRPETIQQLKSFLATINFYRKFMPHAAEIQISLQTMIPGNKKNDKTPLVWTETLIQDFETCRQQLKNAVMLSHPRSDADLSLVTDASNIAAGAALNQIINNNAQPLGYFSKKFTKTQQKYSTYDRELTAMYMAVKHFRDLIEGRVFHILTDHKPLVFAFKQRPEKASPRQINYLTYISQFTTDIRYIKGEENTTADMLSRVISVITNDDIYLKLSQEQQTDDELQNILAGNSSHSITLMPLTLPYCDRQIYCDTSHNRVRPFITKKLRATFLQSTHNLSHPGRTSTTRMMTERFIWPGIRKDCTNFAKNCISCQKSKVHRHTRSEFQSYLPTQERFTDINIDIIGPFPTSEGQKYLLTIIDRFTRWPEAIPMPDMTAISSAKALTSGWISRFGTPANLTSDQGGQFISQVFNELCKTFGIRHSMTSSYHPQSNGIIERFHRTLKSAICSGDSINWIQRLPIILLGLRSTIKEDIGATPAELVYGSTLRLPADFFTPSHKQHTQSEFVKQLRDTMSKLKPTQTSWHTQQKLFINKDLNSSTHAFVRNDSIKTSLTPPYNGPFRIITRHDKYYTLEIKGKSQKISIDRLKPAYFEQEPKPMKQIQPSMPTLSPSNKQAPLSKNSQPLRRQTTPKRVRFTINS